MGKNTVYAWLAILKHYGLSELYVIGKRHLKAVLLGERRKRCRK